MNTIIAFLPQLGGSELLIILFIVLLLFGAKKLPELAKGLGKSMKEFKKAAHEVEEDFKEAMDVVEDTKETINKPLSSKTEKEEISSSSK